MRLLWKKFSDKQLDLLGVDPVLPALRSNERHPSGNQDCAIDASLARSKTATAIVPANGQPLMVPISTLDEDAANPRTEFQQAELDDLTESVGQHGILEAIVVHPADADGRYRIHFGAMRLRAAMRAGLEKVPVIIRDAPADPYAQVAENQKRHGLTPLDMARLIRARVNEGDSNTTIARRMGMNLTTVAHHLALLDLPPELDEALKSGRCTSPRTLHELNKLRDEHPEQVRTLVAGDAEITRAAVSAMRTAATSAAAATPRPSQPTTALARANAACDRLERALGQIKLPEQSAATADLVALRQRVADLAARWLQGV
jgi:ParB family chromosome partitioning protein